MAVDPVSSQHHDPRKPTANDKRHRKHRPHDQLVPDRHRARGRKDDQSPAFVELGVEPGQIIHEVFRLTARSEIPSNSQKDVRETDLLPARVVDVPDPLNLGADGGECL